MWVSAFEGGPKKQNWQPGLFLACENQEAIRHAIVKTSSHEAWQRPQSADILPICLLPLRIIQMPMTFSSFPVGFHLDLQGEISLLGQLTVDQHGLRPLAFVARIFGAMSCPRGSAKAMAMASGFFAQAKELRLTVASRPGFTRMLGFSYRPFIACVLEPNGKIIDQVQINIHVCHLQRHAIMGCQLQGQQRLFLALIELRCTCGGMHHAPTSCSAVLRCRSRGQVGRKNGPSTQSHASRLSSKNSGRWSKHWHSASLSADLFSLSIPHP